MTGAWIGNRWCGYRADRSHEWNRLYRKMILLLSRTDRLRTASQVRLWCAYRDAAAIVQRRLDLLDERRLAA